MEECIGNICYRLLTSEYLDDALKVMRKSFYQYESASVATGVAQCEGAMTELDELSKWAARDGISFIAVDRNTSTVVGVIFNKLQDDASGKNDTDIVVKITNPFGSVRGYLKKTFSGKEYYSFQGIPYARPPLGENRFKVPTRHNDWHGILDAKDNKKICMQKLDSNPLNLNITEDCLNLNIYVPKERTNNSTLLPVLLWIHPGDFISGAGIYEYWGPQFFIEYDIIIVTMNYRLGPFGFVWAEDEIIPGNLGLRDQLFAFDWVFDKIQAFGGDPYNIAIAGQGSGATSVSYHMINTRARDSLFSCAIIHSGSSLSPKYYQPEPKKYAYELAKKIDTAFYSDRTQDLRDLLTSVSAEDIQAAGEQIMAEAGNNGQLQNLIWLPVVEGYYQKNAYLQWQMLTAYSVGEIRIAPIMVGFNSEEMISRSFEPNITKLAELYDNNSAIIPSKKLNVPDEIRTTLGKEIKEVYTKKTFKEDMGAFIRFLSDEVTIPILKQAYNSSWYNLNLIYQFSYKGDLGDNRTVVYPGTNNVGNGEELKYMWDDGTNSDPTKYSEGDRLTQKRLLTLWTNFIKYHDPTPVDDPVLNNITWTFMKENNTQYLNINTTLEFLSKPRVFLELNEIIDQYIQDPLTVF